ncbi:MAG: CDP-alcohol phosphatidyltransferase family protein [Patescibacteria group bacterium]|nr:CDP-alcohol phosphatidyltransferase family protein [Patescibacteria group bacterium]
MLKELTYYLIGEFSGSNVLREVVRNKILTVPNTVTMIGILLTIFYIVQFKSNFWTTTIPIVIFLIGLSDLLDGYLATKFDQHSWVGKFIDGFRDRFLGIALVWNFLHHTTNYLTVTFVAILVGIEVFVAKKNISCGVEAIKEKIGLDVHVSSKIRQFVHLTCAMALVVQLYWLKTVYIGPTALLAIMLLGSVCTLWHKKILWCIDQAGKSIRNQEETELEID